MTARCIGRCPWTAGPGPAADVDKAADSHTRKTGHPTATCSGPTAGNGAHTGRPEGPRARQ